MTDNDGGVSGYGFRQVPYMGVIFVVAEAVKLGYSNGHPDWSNLGQGQPEVGDIEGGPPRLVSVRFEPQDQAYGPLEGTPELRQAVADHYNRLYRRGMQSQYTADNVAIAQGGRLALTRCMAALGESNIGYQLPDYTAYEDMFNLHLSRITPVAVRTRPEDGFLLGAEDFERLVSDQGIRSFILSNPCNPTGSVLRDDNLEALVERARDLGVTLLLDEFYSHFIYDAAPGGATPGAGPVSAARYVEDVDRDPVILFDGLTKSYRYPGWRMGWTVGPPQLVEAIARTASAIDGGPSRVVQRLALRALEPGQADRETAALREVFCRKRNRMVHHLEEMGIRFAAPPEGTFYCWASLENLDPPFNEANTFFRRALQRKVLTVPGEFFDVNPGKRRPAPSPYRHWMRFSFGPDEENMRMGLGRLEQMLRDGH